MKIIIPGKCSLFRFLFISLFFALTGCDSPETNKPESAEQAQIATAKSLTAADKLPEQNWSSFGGTDNEDHASPLDQINTDNVSQLGLAWGMMLDDVDSAATVPVAVEGVLYFAVDQSKVHAVEASTGRLLWRYDPEVAKHAGQKLRFTWGSRGLTWWNKRLYVGTADGRLLAIDAASGELVWSQLTTEADDARGITGAPRVYNGKVIIGHAGADFGPVRGYVTAYDAETGKQLWRFYTVPGNPADGFENEAMAMAAKTWTGEWWKFGGGGTVWNAITYDAEFNQVYLGTGNGAPWNRRVRSPDGGDNLFLSSIVALDADSGEYRWHYQTVPGETWDYNSTMDITLADLDIDGRARKVLMHAPKNGFFYVIDRQSGELLSADKLGKVTWAERVDLESGRPVEAANARYENGETLIWPGSIGLHNWHPMSFNVKTGLVYIPTMEIPGYYSDKGVDYARWSYTRGILNSGLDDWTQDGTPDIASSALIAWDPLRKQEVWRVPTPGMWNGGTLTTAGELVFQGQANGSFNAYAADSGKLLWSFDAKMGITGAPITYTSNGQQYVSVIAGWGSSGPGFLGSIAAQHGWVSGVHKHRVLTFALGGKAEVPANPEPTMVKVLVDPDFQVDEKRVPQGEHLFANVCLLCHGIAAVAGGHAPDLRASAITLDKDAFNTVVKKGSMLAQGMPAFEEFSDEDIESLRHYIRKRARDTLPAVDKQ
ncbi:MAG: quinohemoprotein ethanol dehydrogenase [Gammaproteobacteria bacterium]|jgi:quinohemoprotein ethanol dehydrogenase